MKTLNLIILSVAIFFVFIGISSAQTEIDSTDLYELETIDGNSYLGNIIKEEINIVQFNTGNLGIISFPRSNIKKLNKITKERIIMGKLWFENPQSTRYFWAPNGYGLKKGEGYYQNIWVLWNQSSVGITDYFSVGIGVIPLFLFGSGVAEYTPLFVVPKLSFPVIRDKFNLGAGILAGTIGFKNDAGFGIAYGVSTFGSKNNNFTIGVGYGYADGDWSTHPLINISGMIRLSSKTYFLTENYFFGMDGEWVGFLSAGARSMIRKVGLDYGLFIPISSEIDQIIALPWLGISIPLNLNSK